MKMFVVQFCFTSGLKDIYDDFTQYEVDKVRDHIKSAAFRGIFELVNRGDFKKGVYINYELVERIHIEEIA